LLDEPVSRGVEMRLMWQALSILAAAYGGLALLVYIFQSRLVFFPETGRALFAAANPPKQVLGLAGGHNDGSIFMRESWVKTRGYFLGEQTDKACVR
jgi:hypothetical protein